MISVLFELEQMEFGILIPAIPLPEKSQKECGHSLQLCTAQRIKLYHAVNALKLRI